jgi:tellurite resistance protein TerC
VLYYGVLGAIVFRVLFILGGVVLIEKFRWLIYVLGFFLLATSVRFFLQKTDDLVSKENILVKFCRKFLPVTEQFHESSFFVKIRGRFFVTPLFLTLLSVEMTDLIFATDSIPAIFAITNDPFVMITSNIFAILGLRALYFAFANLVDRFYYLKKALATILFFVSIKILASPFFDIPIGVTLAVVIFDMGVAIFLSILRERRMKNTS